ncbi:hypothetical protein ACHQM5_025483 [Ranunculus cassubicifolius]
MFVGISIIWVYRVTHMLGKGEERWAWLLMFLAELWFGYYWILTQSVRWNLAYRCTFKDRLSQRQVIHICMYSGPLLEPSMMVINTVLSVMAYNYPTEKLSVYLSGDGGSEMTFYALLVASHFSKHWIPFWKKFNIEPRSPAAYFSSEPDSHVDLKDFVYKRVSSKISNGKIILNVDCDMYSNNSGSVMDASCFFMDEHKGHEVAFVQFPQCFSNVTKNDIYGNSLRVLFEIEFPGLDGYGGPLYIGTGCFRRRETLCGRNYSEENKIECKEIVESKVRGSAHEREDTTKSVAGCMFEEGTQWGNEYCAIPLFPQGNLLISKGYKSMVFTFRICDHNRDHYI